MYITFILPDVRGGGAQKMIINLANYYAAEGHKIDLVLFENEGTYKNLISANVNTIIFNKQKALYALKPLSNYFKNNKSIDAVISSMYYINIITIMANMLSGNQQNIIATERNSFTNRIKAESKAHQFIFKKLVRLFYPKSSYIIGISNGVRDDLKKFLSTQKTPTIETIYNPVVSYDFSQKIKEKTSSPFSNKSDLKLIASGRLVAQKDYPTMLRAIADYKEKYCKNFELVILGDGDLKQDILSMIDTLDLQDNVTLLGFVDNPLSIMAYADVFLMSSAWEGFGNVLVEALYCGLKIVSTDCRSGPAEILKNGKHGILTPVGNHIAFSNAIHTAVNSNEMSSPSQKERALDFATENIAREFQKVIETVNA